MRKVLRTLSVFGLAVGLLFAMTVPASATIHEIVASHCSFDHNATVNPPGLSEPGTQSFVRPLLATGVYEEVIIDGATPDESVVVNSDAPAPSPVVATIWFKAGDRIDGPQSKFTWDGTTYFVAYVPVAFDADGNPLAFGALYIPNISPDHPAFLHCENLHQHE